MTTMAARLIATRCIAAAGAIVARATMAARKAVTARIRDTLGRIEQRHPPLGRHLRESIVTGTACCYRPSRDVRWSL